jgi:basic amino acid/polyamine antiporter, APA family
LASLGIIALTGFLIIHITKDLSSTVEAWYFHSTPVWMMVMLFASILFYIQWNGLKKSGVDINKIFSQLPPE